MHDSVPSSPAEVPPLGARAESPDAWQTPFVANIPRTLLCVAALVGVGLGLSYLRPPRYLAHTKIILPNSSARSSALAGLAGTLGLGADGSSLPMFSAILNSDRMLDRLSLHSGLTRRRLHGIMLVRDDVKSNTIEISATGFDKAQMLRLVRDSLEGLNDITAKVNLPVREDQTSRLGATLANRQQSLRKAQEDLRRFLTSAKTLPGGSVDLGIAKIPASTDPTAASPGNDLGTVQTGLGYKQQLSSLEIQLQKLDSSVAAIRQASDAQQSSPPLDLPPVKLWADRIAAAQAKIAEMRSRYQPDSPEIREAERSLRNLMDERRRDVDRYLTSVRASLAGPSEPLAVTRAGVVSQINALKKYVDVAPDETIEYLRLFGNVASAQAIVNQVRLLYEKARLDQGNDPNTWAVLDLPEIDPDFDSRNVTRNVGLGVVGGLAIAYWLGSRRRPRRTT